MGIARTGWNCLLAKRSLSHAQYSIRYTGPAQNEHTDRTIYEPISTGRSGGTPDLSDSESLGVHPDCGARRRLSCLVAISLRSRRLPAPRRLSTLIRQERKRIYNYRLGHSLLRQVRDLYYPSRAHLILLLVVLTVWIIVCNSQPGPGPDQRLKPLRDFNNSKLV